MVEEQESENHHASMQPASQPEEETKVHEVFDHEKREDSEVVINLDNNGAKPSGFTIEEMVDVAIVKVGTKRLR